LSGDPEKEDENWFRPVWEIEGEADLEPPGPPRARKSSPPPDYDHPLLIPLARAQDAVARLETRAEAASEAVAEGLRARMSYLEAAGWLRQAHVWIHPWDLALRDNWLTASIGTGARGDQLESVLPATVAQEPGLELAPSVVVRLDIEVNQALGLARLWRRLGELRSWRPLADPATLREALKSLGSVPEDAEIADWLASVRMAERGPELIRAGRAALDWTLYPGMEQSPASFFLAACLWREKGVRPPIALPFWAAPERHHHRLGLQFGVKWMAEFLECVRAASIVGLQELERLREAEQKGRLLGATVRSRLPDAVNTLLRNPVVTAGSLAKSLAITPQAALGLLRQLMVAGTVREATDRKSWRAFMLSAG
jgi:HTH DNA binding domain